MLIVRHKTTTMFFCCLDVKLTYEVFLKLNMQTYILRFTFFLNLSLLTYLSNSYKDSDSICWFKIVSLFENGLIFVS